MLFRSWTTAGALYLGLSLAAFVALRRQPNGLAWLMTGLLTTWITDTGAYFIGIRWGRRKLAPRLSPKKTWEGAVGGSIVGVAIGAPIAVALIGLAWPLAAVLAAILCVLAALGDLAESMIKRQVGAKDASHLIPGHGGALDRLDSLFFVVPAAYIASLLVERLPSLW